jgi:hypothetical protein
VFAGMIAASFLGIFVIPILYVVFQSLRERIKGADRKREPGRFTTSPPTGEAAKGRLTSRVGRGAKGRPV